MAKLPITYVSLSDRYAWYEASGQLERRFEACVQRGQPGGPPDDSKFVCRLYGDSRRSLTPASCARVQRMQLKLAEGSRPKLMSRRYERRTRLFTGFAPVPKPEPLAKFEDLRWHTLAGIETMVNRHGDSEELIFVLTNGSRYKLYHSQDCCEYVFIKDIAGDLTDLVGAPLVMAEEVSNLKGFDDYDPGDSHTWTFYKLATAKGYVTIAWLGVSNGYYSERVDFGRCP